MLNITRNRHFTNQVEIIGRRFMAALAQVELMMTAFMEISFVLLSMSPYLSFSSRGGLTRFLSLHKPQTTVRPDSSGK